MAKNNKLFWIIVIGLVVVFYLNSKPADIGIQSNQSVSLQSASGETSEALCNTERSDKINSWGAEHVCSQCFQKTSSFLSCAESYGRDDSWFPDEQWIYYYRGTTYDCTSLDSRDKDIISNCLGGGTTCTDPDGETGYTTKATTCRDSECYTDYCQGNSVWEHYCDVSGYPAGILISCESTCSNGACVNQVTACIDSDGQNFVSKGYVTDTNYQSGAKIYDSCSSPTPSQVYEVICTNNQYDVVVKNCNEIGSGYQCTNGACVQGTSCTADQNIQTPSDCISCGRVIDTLNSATCTSQFKADCKSYLQSESTAEYNLLCQSGSSWICSSSCGGTTTCTIKGDEQTCNKICDSEYDSIVGNWKSQQVTDTQYNQAVGYWKTSNNVC